MRFRRGLGLIAAGGLAAALTLAVGCGGEDRPAVDVVDDGSGTGSGTGSVSASGATGSASGSASGPLPTSSPGAAYEPVSNVDSYFAMAEDLRDIRAVMQPATEGNPVDWDEAIDIYENGRNQERSDGIRSLASIPNEDVHAVFPNGSAVYGSDDFINDIVRDGLNGTGRAQGYSDNARRQMVDKGILMLLYAKALQELESAAARVADGNTDDATGAPHAVDEAWGAIAGPDEGGTYPHGLLGTAASREGNFGLEGRLRDPLIDAFVEAQMAAREGDVEAFGQAHEEIRGYLNSIFYLASLRYANSLLSDETPGDREVHLAEGWTFFQTIRASVAAGSADAEAAVTEAYTRSADEPYPESATQAVYAALNQDGVLRSLQVPEPLVVLDPPQ